MFSCKACTPADPATSTVKVNNPAVMGGADKENINHPQQPTEQEKLQQQREREARERKEREEHERQQRIKEQELQEAARRAEELQRQQEQEDMERRRAAEVEELRRREEEERRHRDEQQRLEEAKRQEMEREKREQDQKAAADREKLESFLSSKGYGEDVNGKRKTLPGADPSFKSSSGKTPLQRAQKWNTTGSLDQVCTLLSAAEQN